MAVRCSDGSRKVSWAINSKLFGVLGYHSGVLCLLHSPADPAGIADEGDDLLIKRFAKKGARVLGVEALPPYQLHTSEHRDKQTFGDPFDFFYMELGLIGCEIETVPRVWQVEVA